MTESDLGIAADSKTSVDAVVVTVLSELNRIIALKKVQLWKFFSVELMFLLPLNGFGKSLVYCKW